jgi:hypothetical protein
MSKRMFTAALFTRVKYTTGIFHPQYGLVSGSNSGNDEVCVIIPGRFMNQCYLRRPKHEMKHVSL